MSLNQYRSEIVGLVQLSNLYLPLTDSFTKLSFTNNSLIFALHQPKHN